MIARADVVREARTWIHTPFVHLHRTKGVGVDCAGLVIGVARELGLVEATFDVQGYARTPDGRSLLELCDRFMTRISAAQMQPGDVLVLRYGSDPQHMGIIGDYIPMIGHKTLIHAYGTADGKGEVQERRLDGRVRIMMPVQAYALPGVE